MKLAIVLSVFLTIAVLQTTSKTAPTEKDVRSLLDDAKEALKKLDEILQAALTDAINAINTLKTRIGELQQQVIDAAKREIDQITKPLYDELNDWIGQAAAVGIDVTECTSQGEADLNQLPVTTLNDIMNCVTIKVNGVLDIVSSTLTEIQGYEQEVANLGTELDNCGDGILSIPCITEVLAKITEDTISLPGKIADSVAKLTAVVDNLLTDLESCEKQSIEDLKTGGEKLVGDMVECIKNKLLSGRK